MPARSSWRRRCRSRVRGGRARRRRAAGPIRTSGRSGRSWAPALVRLWSTGSTSTRSSDSMARSGRKPVAFDDPVERSGLAAVGGDRASPPSAPVRDALGAEPGDELDDAGVDDPLGVGAEPAAFGQLVVGLAAEHLPRIVASDDPGDLGARDSGRRARRDRGRRSGRSGRIRRRRRGASRSGDGHGRARRGCPPRSDRSARRSPIAGRPSAPSGFGVYQVPEASITARARVRSRPCGPSVVTTNGARRARRCVTLSVPARVMPVTSRLVRSPGEISGRSGEWFEVVLDEVAAGGVLVGVGGDPAVGLEQPSGGGVDVVAPRREQLDMRPFADAGGDVVADLEHDERDVALVEVGGGGEADRAGPDHGDGKGGWGSWERLLENLIRWCWLRRTRCGWDASSRKFASLAAGERLHESWG